MSALSTQLRIWSNIHDTDKAQLIGADLYLLSKSTGLVHVAKGITQDSAIQACKDSGINLLRWNYARNVEVISA
jgi:hypothetical protein